MLTNLAQAASNAALLHGPTQLIEAVAISELLK